MNKMEERITILLGEKKLKPLTYSIVGGKTNRPWYKWWLPREQWFVTSEFIKIGPYDSYQEAAKVLIMAKYVK